MRVNRSKKAAVIGCGMISKNHLRAVAQIPFAHIAAVCDIDRGRAEQAAAEFGSGRAEQTAAEFSDELAEQAAGHGIERIYTDYRELLADPEIDVVHICTPHYLHCEMAVAALAAGKHVLCEKPMALSSGDAARMAAAAKKAGKQLGICFQNRYNEASVYLRQLMDSGQMGKLLGARGQVTWDRKPEYYSGSTWRGRWETEGGGVLINQAIHTFDLLQWLTGEMVFVEAGIAARRLKDVIAVEDTAEIYMQGTGGERILFYASNCYVKNAPAELEIICESGSLKLVGNQVQTELDGERQTRDFSPGTVLGNDYWGSGHGALIEDFYDCVETGRMFPVSAEAAMVSVKLLEAVYASAAAGQRVYL